MTALLDYLAMNGYWPFVWSAYGFAACVLIGLLLASLRSLRENERATAALENARARRRGGGRYGTDEP